MAAREQLPLQDCQEPRSSVCDEYQDTATPRGRPGLMSALQYLPWDTSGNVQVHGCVSSISFPSLTMIADLVGLSPRHVLTLPQETLGARFPSLPKYVATSLSHTKSCANESPLLVSAPLIEIETGNG